MLFRVHHSSNGPRNCGPPSVLMLTGMPCSANHSLSLSFINFPALHRVFLPVTRLCVVTLVAPFALCTSGAMVTTVTVAIALGRVSFFLGPPPVVHPGSLLEAIGVTTFVYQFRVPHGASVVTRPASLAV